MRKNRIRFYGRLFLELCMCCGIIAYFYGMTVDEGVSARWTANRRACYVTQRNISGALEVYCFETKEKVNKFDDSVFSELKKHGLLSTIPMDPGGDEQSFNNYFLTPDGRVFCSCHGFAKPPAGTDGAAPRDQLLAAGFYCPDILVAASKEPVDLPPGARDERKRASVWAALFFLLLLVRLYEVERDFGFDYLSDLFADKVVDWWKSRNKEGDESQEDEDDEQRSDEERIALRKEVKYYVDHIQMYGVEPLPEDEKGP